jgi:hypothetical protein
VKSEDEIVQWIAARIVALVPRFPQLRDFDVAIAVSEHGIVYQRGVTLVPDPDHPRLLREYEAAVRAEPYRKRQPPPSATMPSYDPDGISLLIHFISVENASRSAAVRWPGSRVGDFYCDSSVHGPDNASFAELAEAIAQIISDAASHV